MSIVLVLFLLGGAALAQAQYTNTNADGSIYLYDTNADGSITIHGYSGPPWAVTIPTNINSLTVSSIGDSAFANCAALTSVSIPATVTSIQYYAFADCTNLASVTIAASITNIEGGAFAGCTSLPAITVDAQNPFFSTVNGILFDKPQTMLVEYPGGIGGSYTVPSKVTSIGECAFQGCISLTNVTIPISVTNIGVCVFQDCSGLSGVTIPTSIPDYAFLDCTNLTRVNFPDNVENIGFFAFYNCSSLADIAIPGRVTNLGEMAFAGCTSLTNVTIARGVASIEEWAFGGCFNLTSVFFGGSAPTIGSDLFYYDTDVTVYYLSGTTGWGEFSSNAAVRVVLWNPVIQTGDGSFGVRNNQFGFNITGTTNIPIVMEACTNLASPIWTPVTNFTLTNGLFYFSDSQWTNYSSRFYQISAP